MSQPPNDLPPQPPTQQYPPQYQQPYPMPYGQPGYSPQYSFMPYYLTPPEALLGPARRASLMLFIIGALMLLGGTCVGVAVAGATDAIVNDALNELRSANPEQAAMLTPTFIRTVYGVMSVCVALAGIVAIVMGIFVRGGGRGALITTLVLLALPTAGGALLVLGSLLGGPAAFLGALLTMLVPFVLVAMTIKFLITAIRIAPQVDAARYQMAMSHQQQQMQYQAYAQQQQYQSQQEAPPPASPPPA